VDLDESLEGLPSPQTADPCAAEQEGSRVGVAVVDERDERRAHVLERVCTVVRALGIDRGEECAKIGRCSSCSRRPSRARSSETVRGIAAK